MQAHIGSLRGECVGQGAVQDAVAFESADSFKVVTSRNNERIGPVVAVVKNAAGRGTPDHFARGKIVAGLRRKLGADVGDFLSIAKGKRRAMPAIVSKAEGGGGGLSPSFGYRFNRRKSAAMFSAALAERMGSRWNCMVMAVGWARVRDLHVVAVVAKGFDSKCVRLRWSEVFRSQQNRQ